MATTKSSAKKPHPAPSDPKERSSLFVGSTEKAFQVLEAFHGPHRHMSMAEIARTAELDRSATQRLVYTLEKLGYLRRIPDSLLYGLSSKVLRLSYHYLRSHDLIERASPYLLDISRSLGETVNLHELDGHEVVFLARFPGQHLMNVDFAVGHRLPAVFTASGRAILSRLGDAQRRAVIAATPLQAATAHTETDPQALLARIEEAAHGGYALTMNQTMVGDIAVAVAITDEQGLPVGAINVSVPTTRWTVEKARDQLVAHVQLAATSISKSR
ncbi:IclR family transcriptional regulator [Verminephrobacter aporrectodeae subsp. tuberculatae]|uniref:IclR family transcriptional regulator n=1 Tax=Verminephrobacter aporrectodeae subsp. tuberculatae TaxID=1110392 RepID=A0ABT3KQ78_9BURK|nr:IclR family transcriptional regulator C-terminal domain-containing protein [Verminephrobacter aporrectodeae]MCW5220549.1 IclR family transcriptional regulator [Verminephrobacter aporrectodeae subsp. tuberculatae]MCW5255495.1 IclR family transcriptional regulator [Verminephrobacter aporrectodeae subsp. tuberculatae]MCW5289845.1 IclR family transcriptional regulator [Verminephrobacter aporrectodeae subsp. tuberculatae]MCW5320477.1 IclR family transcriptional regulator [Verminephrobacter aporre